MPEWSPGERMVVVQWVHKGFRVPTILVKVLPNIRASMAGRSVNSYIATNCGVG